MLFKKGDTIKSLRNIAAGNGTLFLAGTVFYCQRRRGNEPFRRILFTIEGR